MSGSRLACTLLLLLPSLSWAGAFEQGVDALDKKSYDQAIASFTACLRESPADAAVFTNRGIAYAAKGEYDRAIADYTEAVRLNPRVAVVFVNRGIAHAEKRELGRAVADFTAAVKLDPRLAAAFYYRGNAHADRKDYDQAIADYTTVLELDPKDAVALNNRGIAHANKKSYDKAFKDYAAAVHLDPKYAHALNNFAWLLATCPLDELRDGKTALAHATKSCEMAGWKLPGRLSTLAAAHAECGDFKEAVKWENKAIEIGYTQKMEMDQAMQRLRLYEAGKPYREK